MQDYYRILGVDRSASFADIKRAYRQLIANHHPDKGGDEQQVWLINEAYAVLKDPAKRAKYDVYHSVHFGVMGGFVGQWQSLKGRFDGVSRQATYEASKVATRLVDVVHQMMTRFAKTDHNLDAITIDLATAYFGGRVQIQHQHKLYWVDLPKHLADGMVVDVMVGETTLTRRIIISEPDVQVIGEDVYRMVSLYPWQWALQEPVRVYHPLGDFDVVPTLNLGDDYLKMTGLGLKKAGKSGDLYLRFVLKNPDVNHLSDQQKQAFINLKIAFGHLK